MGDGEPRRKRQRLVVRSTGVGVAVQCRLDIPEGKKGARTLRILGNELLRRRELPADVILEPPARDLNLQLLGVRRSGSELFGACEVALEFVERVARVCDIQIGDRESGISRDRA